MGTRGDHHFNWRNMALHGGNNQRSPPKSGESRHFSVYRTDTLRIRSLYKHQYHILCLFLESTFDIIISDFVKAANILRMIWHRDDVIKWKLFPRNWPSVRGIHQSPVFSPHKGQWRGALMFSLICVWINGWVNNRKAGDLRRYHTH